MLYYDRIDISEGIDINQTSESKECNICHYWYFLNKGFKFQLYVCRKCHGLSMMSMNLSDIHMLKIKDANYYCINSGISIKLLQNICLKKVGHCKDLLKLNIRIGF